MQPSYHHLVGWWGRHHIGPSASSTKPHRARLRPGHRYERMMVAPGSRAVDDRSLTGNRAPGGCRWWHSKAPPVSSRRWRSCCAARRRRRSARLSRFGTAAWFAIIGGAMLAAGWALWTGRRWGRGVAVFAQLLAVARWLGTWPSAPTSGSTAYPSPSSRSSTLVLLFSPSAVQWLGAQDPPPTIVEEAPRHARQR